MIDERNHPFYSDKAIEHWKQRMKEIEKEEKERAQKKAKPRKDSPKQSLEGVEGGCPQEGKLPVRVVRKDRKGPKLPPHPD